MQRRFGGVDVSISGGYNVIGAPSGTQTNNPWDGEIVAAWTLNEKVELFAEYTYVDAAMGSLRQLQLRQ